MEKQEKIIYLVGMTAVGYVLYTIYKKVQTIPTSNMSPYVINNEV
jgi:hypothetical protein